MNCRPGPAWSWSRTWKPLLSATAASIPVAGQWRGGLGNAGEMLTLMVGQQMAQQFRYDDHWYATPMATVRHWSSFGLAMRPWISGRRRSIGGPVCRMARPAEHASSGPAMRTGMDVFDSADMIAVLQLGEYEDNVAKNSSGRMATGTATANSIPTTSSWPSPPDCSTRPTRHG